jgi:hypothetical protein
MPEKKTIERARRDKAEGKAPTTQAGEFVREEIHHVREGKHGARNAKQAIAIGLSKARRAGVKMPVPEKGTVPEPTRVQAKREARKAGAKKKISSRRPNPKRSQATKRALKREPTAAASRRALGRQARTAAARRRKRSATPRRRTKKASATT